MKIRVEWDFEDTEYEGTPYNDAVDEAGLPHEIKLPPDVAYEDDDGISDWLSEQYGYTTLDWWSV